MLFALPLPATLKQYISVHFMDDQLREHKMSQVEVERFLGRIITDAKFRTKAVHSLETVFYSEGLSLSAAEKSFLRVIDYSLLNMIAELIDDSIKRA